jgi:hypothetical protein
MEFNGSAERQIGGPGLFEMCANYRCKTEGFVRKKLGSEQERSVLGM